MVGFLKKNHKKIVSEVLHFDNKTSDLLLFKPIREKYFQNLRYVVNKTLPRFYDRWDELEGEIDVLINQDIQSYFIQRKGLLNKKVVMNKCSSQFKKSTKYYDNLMMDLATIIVYKQAKIYGKKYNLIGHDRIEVIEVLSHIFEDQVGPRTLDRLYFLKKNAKKRDLKKVQDMTRGDYYMSLDNLK